MESLRSDRLRNETLHIKEKINYGRFSKVYRGELCGKEIAVKVIDLEKTSNNYRTKFLPREIRIISRLRHPNLVAIHEIFNKASKVYMLMDLAERGDLLKYLDDNGPLPESKCQMWFKQIADALAYVHSSGFAHRDVKAENILIDRHGFVKITDFGFSRSILDSETGQQTLSETFCGSVSYCAPEVIQGTPYDPILADVWSIGIVLFVMINNSFPFDESSLNEMIEAQQKKTYKYQRSWVPSEVKQLIETILEPDTHKRPTMAVILNNPWLSGIPNVCETQMKSRNITSPKFNRNKIIHQITN